MKHIEGFMLDNMFNFLKPIEEIWQPTDFLPDSSKPEFFDQVKDLQASARELPYDLMIVLIGDTITEEALPTYESWLATVEGVSQDEEGGLHFEGYLNKREVSFLLYYSINDLVQAGVQFNLDEPPPPELDEEDTEAQPLRLKFPGIGEMN